MRSSTIIVNPPGERTEQRRRSQPMVPVRRLRRGTNQRQQRRHERRQLRRRQDRHAALQRLPRVRGEPTGVIHACERAHEVLDAGHRRLLARGGVAALLQD